MRLKIIRTSNHEVSTASALDQLKQLGNDVLKGVDYVFDPGGPGPIVENRADCALVVPELMKRVKETNEEGGFDAIVIQGFLDPGLFTLREVSAIPVVGCGHSAMHVASLIGTRFSIVDTLETMAIMIREMAVLYGFDRKLISIRSIETRPRDLMARLDREHRIEIMTDECRQAIQKDGADTLVFGCTSLGWMADEVRDRLWKEGLRVPVVYPYRSAIAMAKALVEMRLGHSAYAYSMPTAPKPRPVPIH